MFYMPNQEGCKQANVPRISADTVYPTVPFSVNQIINMQDMSNVQNVQNVQNKCKVYKLYRFYIFRILHIFYIFK